MAATSETKKMPSGFFRKVIHHSTEVVSPASKVYVYEAPVRFWHWMKVALRPSNRSSSNIHSISVPAIASIVCLPLISV